MTLAVFSSACDAVDYNLCKICGKEILCCPLGIRIANSSEPCSAFLRLLNCLQYYLGFS